MILYTPLSQEDIFPSKDEPMIESVDYNGKKIIVNHIEGRATVIQLVSTDPHDYMDPAFIPGQEIELK